LNQFERVAFALAGGVVELALRAFKHRWILDEEVKHVFPDGRSLTAEKGMEYDSFTWAPNLRNEDGSRSRAAAPHDKGWVTGKKDDGTFLTFDENNASFRAVLDKEGHPEWVKDLYSKGVSLPFMRNKWRRTHRHQ